MNALAAKRPLAGGFSRRGACPALSAPMQTGDGLLVRLNPVTGGLSPSQFAGLCDAADRHGNGIIEVTARGSIQIRGLTESSAPLFAQAVDRLGIDVRTGVPVQTGVIAGLDPQEIADPTRLADMIRSGIAETGLEGRLGPKVSVVIDGGGRTALDQVAADVRLTAVVAANGVPSWQVSISGDSRTAKRLGVAADESAACEATLELLSSISAMGLEARARDLLVADRHVAVPRDRPEDDVDRGASLLGIANLRKNLVALGVALPFGHTTSKLLKTFAQAATNLAIGDIRPAPERTLVAICGTATQAEALRAHAAGFVVSSDDPRLSVSACPGAPDCASGHIPARRIAADIASEHGKLLDGSVHLHVSGCAKGCAHPGVATLTLVGSEAGTGLVIDGTARDEPLAISNSDSAGRGFANVAGRVAAQRLPHETTAQAIQRLGLSTLAEAFGRRDA
jgi:precorrin-3B synthase